MDLTLFIGNKRYSSWSMRPWVLMRQLSIPFTESMQPFLPGHSHRQPQFAAFSPTATVPCLHVRDTTTTTSTTNTNTTDDANHPVVVWDSLAIAEFLHDSHPAVWPSSPAARAFARSAAAEMHSSFRALRDGCPMHVGLRLELSSPSHAALSADLRRLERLWREGLDRFGGPYLCGERFCAADAFFAPVATRVRTYMLAVDEVAMRYVETLLATAAVREWVEQGLAEEFREEWSEVEVRKMGRVVEEL